MLAKVQNDLTMAALRSLQAEIGGEIKGDKLFPIGSHLSALLPLEPASNLQRRWHVVQTEPQQEKDVAKRLKDDCKLDSYCPLEPKRVRVNCVRHRTVTRPMFVSYVFAGFDVSYDPWQTIMDMRGVVRLLMIALRPVPIAPDVIERIELTELQLSGGWGRNQTPITLAVGALVRILEPFSFSGLFGDIVKIDQEKHEIGVEIEIFGRMVPLTLSPEQVEPV